MKEYWNIRKEEKIRNRDIHKIDFFIHEFYKSYLIIETKITTPSNTQDKDT